jgi:hypothetical protein
LITIELRLRQRVSEKGCRTFGFLALDRDMGQTKLDSGIS